MASVKMMNNLGAGRERLCGSHGERGAQGTLRAETASSNGRIDSGRCRGAQRDGVAVAQRGGGTAWRWHGTADSRGPTARGTVLQVRLARSSISAWPAGMGILPDRCQGAPSPWHSSRAAWVEDAGSAPADVRHLSEQSCGVRTRRTRQKRIPKGRREVNRNL